jgi:hypothetical protein
MRASIIVPSYKDLNNIFMMSWRREERREKRGGLMQKIALARAPRHFVSVSSGLCIHKIAHLCS